MTILLVIVVVTLVALIAFVLGTEFTAVFVWSPSPDWKWDPNSPDGMQWDDGKWKLYVRHLRDVEWDLENGVMTASLRPDSSSRKESSVELEPAF